MFLVLKPRFDPMGLRQDDNDYYECFVVSDPVATRKYLQNDGWVVYSLVGLKQVTKIDITAEVELV
jgi:hypothetical protein